MTPLQELAQQVLLVLDAQQAYFQYCRLFSATAEEKGRLLNESRRLERELRARCAALLDTAATPSLFDVMDEAAA